MSKKDTRNRGWIIVLNNYSEEDYNKILEYTQIHSEKFILGKEVGDKEKTPHIQGYVYWKNGKSFEAMKKLFENIIGRLGTHIEVAKGKFNHQLVYCSKDGKYVSKGLTTPEPILTWEQRQEIEETHRKEHLKWFHETYPDGKFKIKKAITNKVHKEPEENIEEWYKTNEYSDSDSE